jgi:glycogen operon protein
MAAYPDRLEAGAPFPLGATWNGLGTNFAVFSGNATRIDLCIFDPAGRREVARFTLPEYTDEVWHGYLPGGRTGMIYGYRAYGPYDPQNGHRFNPHKLLLDPYARRTTGELRSVDALYGYRLNSPRGDLSFDRRDSAPAVMKAVVTADTLHWGDDRSPNIPWSDLVIYEAHLRGLTMLRQDIRPRERGTFAALAEPGVIDHLRRLGVNAIELMPIHAFVQDQYLLKKNLRNYWGYNTLSFFAIEPNYLSDGSAEEMRLAVRHLHAAGIEVILDVVYNHTAEGSELGPTLSFRGLDNASYYRLMPDNPRHLINDTGTGNTFNLSHPRVLQLVMDSLRYWVTNFHIDGFRFDLGVTLGREAHGFDPGAGFFDAIRQDPALSRVKLIVEPWDPGPGGYQLGGHPPGFGEWNDRFRDGVRRFWRGDEGQRSDFSARLAGSADIFEHRGRRPYASINFAACHDGFTLRDTVSYTERHNEANGEDNKDGSAENNSANWGIEGQTDDPKINDVRRHLQYAMLATVLLSQGTPMILGGDEFGHSQNGNNNGYCQDNETSWLSWEQANSPEGQALTEFVGRLSALRHRYPVLRLGQYLHGKDEPAPGLLDIQWFDQQGNTMTSEAWNNPQERTLVLQRAAKEKSGSVSILTCFFNPTPDDRTFKLPPPKLAAQLLIDSAAPDQMEKAIEGDTLLVKSRSVVLTKSVREATS